MMKGSTTSVLPLFLVEAYLRAISPTQRFNGVKSMSNKVMIGSIG